jgi:hypothetical protein
MAIDRRLKAKRNDEMNTSPSGSKWTASRHPKHWDLFVIKLGSTKIL